MPGIGGNGKNIVEAVRFIDRPLQQLLATHTAPDADPYSPDTQRIP
jgi:hypothetical protein